MYYGIDENGNIVMSPDSSVLPDQYQSLYPEEIQDVPLENETPDQEDSSLDSPLLDDSLTGSGNFVSNPTIIIQPSPSDAPFDYDALSETLADVPSYTVYPSTTAVTVLTNVINHLDYGYGYLLFSGSSTSETYLYYSRDYVVSGNRITLVDPIRCTYYQYRPSSSTQMVYTYTVSQVDDITLTLSNQLVYTNLKDGYPDLMEYKHLESYTLLFTISLCAIILACLSFAQRFRSKKKGD